MYIVIWINWIGILPKEIVTSNCFIQRFFWITNAILKFQDSWHHYFLSFSQSELEWNIKEWCHKGTRIGVIKEGMKQFTFQFYFDLVCNKMFFRLLLSMAVFVTLTRGHFNPSKHSKIPLGKYSTLHIKTLFLI